MKKDHCTLSPDGWWGKCCKRHDRRYANKRLTRLQADILLFRCISRESNVIIGSVYFIGVRLFGSKYYREAQNA